MTTPENPGKQVHPENTLTPVLFSGQALWLQLDKQYAGGIIDATTTPERPALQVQPLGTLIPLLSAGQGAAIKD